MDSSLDFESLMQSGVLAHARGEYESALNYRLQALHFGSYPELWDFGRAARDVAACYDRLGKPDKAELYAAIAYREHAELKNLGIEQGIREFTVSALYAGITAVRQKKYEDALWYTTKAWTASEELFGKYTQPHQYDINLAGRVAGIEGTLSRPTKNTREIAKLAVKWSKLSETDQVLDRSSQLTEEDVKAAQSKAWQRAVAARSIILMQSLPTRKLTRPIAKLALAKVVL